MYNQMAEEGPSGEETAPQQQVQAQQTDDPVKLLQVRLAKGEITPEQYQASLNVLKST
jgi:uncharacterized membrane protein